MRISVEENTEINNLCLCGCKQIVTGFYYNSRKKEYVQRRFIKGHHVKGKNNPMYKGGFLSLGYRFIYSPDHPFRNKKNHIQEHRLVMEAYLGRLLTKQEVIHHIIPISKGGTNDISNLMLFPNHAEHTKFEKTKDMSKRFCLLCRSKETYIHKKTGCQYWFRYQDGVICRKCYDKINREAKHTHVN